MKVLFCCLGNICRSPMAEAVMNHLLEKKNLDWKVDSCGTIGYHAGQKSDSRTISICKKHNIPCTSISRKITLKDFKSFDYILCMDEENLEDLTDLAPKDATAKIQLLGEYDPKHKRSIIEDPYYGGPKGFQINFDQVTRCCNAFIQTHSLEKETKS